MLNKLNLLLIENDEASINILIEALKRIYNISVCSTYKETEEQFANKLNNYNIIIADINLDMNIFPLLDDYKPEMDKNNIILFIISGYFTVDTVSRAYQLKPDFVLEKPFKIIQLKRELKKYINKKIKEKNE